MPIKYTAEEIEAANAKIEEGDTNQTGGYASVAERLAAGMPIAPKSFKNAEEVNAAVNPTAQTVTMNSPQEGATQIPVAGKGQVVVRAGNKIEGLVPTTIQEAWLFCQKMAQSFSLPAAYYKKPTLPDGMKEEQLPPIMDIATSRAMQAMQLGMEVGLPPAQAIQSVLIMNGVGTIWGDSQLGLVLGSGMAEYVKEYIENEPMLLDSDKPNPKYTWVCETKRRGVSEPYFGRFTIAEAQKAGLWGKTSQYGKASTWVTHPQRMGKYKARAFCLRDVYADVLKGLCHSQEEFEGETIDVTPNGSAVTPDSPAAELTKILNKQQ